MPITIQHVVHSRFGDPSEVLELVSGVLPDQLKPDQVRMSVRSCSLNPVDFKLMEGKFAAGPKGWPKRVGTDCSGVISAVGTSVSGLSVGDEVYCDAIFRGPLSTEVTVPSRIVSKKPAQMSFSEAATLPLAALTALQGLRDKLKIVSGQRVLVTGGSGGVGSLAIQLAKAMGCYVATTSSNEELCKSLGADVVVNYRNAKFEDVLKDAGKFDAVYDTVGGAEQWVGATKILKKGGRFATIVGDGTGGMGKIVQQLLYRKLFTPFGYDIYLTNSNSKDLDVISQYVANGQLKAVIDDTSPVFQFTEAGVKDAFAKIKTGRVKGKLVIKVSD